MLETQIKDGSEIQEESMSRSEWHDRDQLVKITFTEIEEAIDKIKNNKSADMICGSIQE